MKKVLSIFMILLFATHAVFALDFKLKSVTNDHVFDSKDYKGKFIAIHFLLKTECPICLRFTNEYFKKSSQLKDVEQIFLKPDSEEEIKAWASDLKESYPIYRDPGAALAKRFKIPDGYKFHGEVVHYPAVVILDPNGKEIFRYVGKNTRDRFNFKSMLDKMKELRKK